MARRKWYRLSYTKPYVIAKAGLWRENSVVSSTLGICSALAITNSVENGIAMGLGVTFTAMMASLVTSLIREYIPMRLRMITYMVIISTFVISVDLFLRGFFPEISRSLGPYVSLIITNCLIMGRCESFAFKNPPVLAALDGLAHGLGYSFVILILSAIREVLAFGTLLNINVVGAGWTNWVVMAMAPGGFFLLAVIVWAVRTMQPAGLEEDGSSVATEERMLRAA